MSGPVRLVAQDLSVGYEGHAVISHIDFELHAGEIFTLIGPNGAGKSTILKTLASSLEIVSGQVLIGASDLSKLSAKELSLKMAVVLTEHLRTELMTCQDVVEAGRYPYTGRLGVLDEKDRAIAREVMELVHVTQLAQRDFMQISDGQRQRVLIARAICQDPQILLLDEPTTFLDIRYQIELLEILRELAHNKGIAIIMSLHELNLARIISDMIMCVKNDSVFSMGSPDEIFQPDIIDQLYGLVPKTYDPQTGIVTLEQE